MPKLSVARLLRRLAERDPERPAVTDPERSITRAELERTTNHLARAYQRLGVGQDDLVTIALPNGVGFYEAALATWKLGATPQPVSARLPRPELQAIIELADPALVVGIDADQLGGRSSVRAGFEPDPALSDEPLPDRVARYWKAPTSGGSTGRPKIIVSREPAAFDPEEDPPLGLARDRALLVPGPLYHNAPFSMSAGGLLYGNHVVVMARFDAARCLEWLERYSIDWTLMVPTMMHRIWRLEEAERNRYDLSSLRILLHLGAPCPAWLKEEWIHWLGPDRICELYGGTESQSVTWITGREWLEHRGSVGRPITGRMRVLDPEGHELPPGETGEIYMMPDGGPGSTYHYIGDEAASREGWESLGDLGWMDDQGYIYVTDRQSDMILSGGANVYPAEVEAALESHPLVRSSAVIGLPDDDLGQRVHALVHATGRIGDDELRTHLAERLARYKIPRSFEYVSAPLRDDAGKLRRSALREARIEQTPRPPQGRP